MKGPFQWPFDALMCGNYVQSLLSDWQQLRKVPRIFCLHFNRSAKKSSWTIEPDLPLSLFVLPPTFSLSFYDDVKCNLQMQWKRELKYYIWKVIVSAIKVKLNCFVTNNKNLQFFVKNVLILENFSVFSRPPENKVSHCLFLRPCRKLLQR